MWNTESSRRAGTYGAKARGELRQRVACGHHLADASADGVREHWNRLTDSVADNGRNAVQRPRLGG